MKAPMAYSEALADRYDSHHFGGNSGYHVLLKDCAALAALLPPSPCLVLDIPCGTGIYTAQLCSQGYDVIAADASEPMLKLHCRARDRSIHQAV